MSKHIHFIEGHVIKPRLEMEMKQNKMKRSE